MNREKCVLKYSVLLVITALAKPQLSSSDPWKDEHVLRLAKNEWVADNDNSDTKEEKLSSGLLRDAEDLPDDVMMRKVPDVFRTKPRSFKATLTTKLAMYRLMKRGGILQNEGFSRAGTIQVSGQASVIFSRPFRNIRDLCTALDASTALRLTAQEVAVGLIGHNPPMPSLTNYLLTPVQLGNLRRWLESLVKRKDFKLRGFLKDKKLHVIIVYRCCYPIVTGDSVSLYGGLFVRVG